MLTAVAMSGLSSNSGASGPSMALPVLREMCVSCQPFSPRATICCTILGFTNAKPSKLVPMIKSLPSLLSRARSAVVRQHSSLKSIITPT